jgi:Fe-S cluster biosynthesis and repair protein YggX
MSDAETTSNDTLQCVRCEKPDRKPILRSPFPNDLGQRLVAEICLECWDEWKQRQMLLINHYGLNVRDPRAREFLVTNLASFLFAEGDDQAEIDASQEGKVNW